MLLETHNKNGLVSMLLQNKVRKSNRTLSPPLSNHVKAQLGVHLQDPVFHVPLCWMTLKGKAFAKIGIV
jgi:hypothetical protein